MSLHPEEDLELASVPPTGPEVADRRDSFRVLHLTQSSAPGGIQRLLRELVPLQVERGLIVGVACPPTNGLDPIVRASGARSYEWRATRGFRVPALVRESVRLRWIVSDFRPDVVHLHSSKAGLIGRLTYRGPAVFQPQAWSFHHVPAIARPVISSWERLGQHLVTRTICSSLEEQREGLSRGIGRDASVIENGIDLRQFPVQSADDRLAARSALGIAPHTPLAVCVGRFCRQKGQDMLLEAWPSVLGKVPDAVLLLVGGGPDEASLKRRETPNVQWLPWQTDVRPHLAAADVVVMPSRWEGMSFGLIEALASGRSVVATSATAMRENIEPSQAGAVVELDAVAPLGLAKAIVERLTDPELCAREGSNGRRRAEELDIGHMEERLYAEYRAVLAVAGRRRV